MRVLMVGDVVGKPGRKALAQVLPGLRRELRADVVIANGENAAAGRGITPATARELLEAGADVLTSGNHVFDQKDILPHLDGELPLLRPANYPAAAPGRGMITIRGLTVLNLQGRSFMVDIDDPFRLADEALESLRPGALVVVDMHAETTAEKAAMGWYLDGRVAAVLGTHTHVPTADHRILPGGTAFVCDVGMVGPRDSIIGNDVQAVIQRFLTGMPTRLPVAEHSPAVQFNAVLVDVDESTGRARSIERVDREIEPHGK